MLVTTEGRHDAQAHITDMGETIARLASAHDLHGGLSEVAQQAKAHEAGDQDDVTKTLKDQNDEIKGQGGDIELGHFPEFQQPHLTLASPAGIQSTAEGSTHITSGEHTAFTSGGHTSISAGKSLLVSARRAVRMFAHNAGMRLIAASSDIDITALKNSINLLARLNIKLEAGRITITAREEVVIVGGGSSSRWNDAGIVHGTAGLWREHAATHSFAGPKSLPVPDSSLPRPAGNYREFFIVQDETGKPLPNYPYEMFLNGASFAKARTDAQGRTRIANTDAPEQVSKTAARRPEQHDQQAHQDGILHPTARTQEHDAAQHGRCGVARDQSAGPLVLVPEGRLCREIPAEELQRLTDVPTHRNAVGAQGR
jgi:type VI secretion system secreted protein VgrG